MDWGWDIFPKRGAENKNMDVDLQKVDAIKGTKKIGTGFSFFFVFSQLPRISR